MRQLNSTSINFEHPLKYGRHSFRLTLKSFKCTMIHLLVHISPLYTADFILAPILNRHIRRLGNAIFKWLCRQNIILTRSVARMGGCFFVGRSVWCRPWYTHSGIWMAEIAAALAAGAHLITVVEGCGLSGEGEEKGSEWGDGSCDNRDVILDAGTRVSAYIVRKFGVNQGKHLREPNDERWCAVWIKN